MPTMGSTKSFGCPAVAPGGDDQQASNLRSHSLVANARGYRTTSGGVRLGAWISVRSERARGRDDVAGDRGAVRDSAIVGREEQLAGALADLPRRKPEEPAPGVRRVVEEDV